ncbi:glycosyltransferase family 39 protein, partial [bacterium]|nr:glycosyltransferase family 39 protein [bacterium]
MFKQFFQKALVQVGSIPKTWWLYGLAGLLILLGQGLIFARNITGGLIFSLAGVLALSIALAGEARLEGYCFFLRRVSQNFLAQIETIARRWNQKGFALFKTGYSRQSAEVKEQASFPDTPLESEVVPMIPDPIILAVPKRAFIVVGLICLAASQLLLFAGHLAWGVSLVILAFPTLLGPILSRESHLTLGRLDVLLKTVLIAVSGLGAVLVGNFLMLKNMELNIAKEIAGYLLNLAGILLLIKLIPRIIPDPEPEAGNPLDRWTGEARSPWGVAVKVLLVLAAVLLLVFARQAGGFERVTLLVLAAIAALGLSFPWARQNTINAEPSLLAILGLRFLRLTAFGVALYLGFRGQSLIAQEQLYAGLFRFGAAAMALIFAFREPDPRVSDSLQEQPLKWYWEALGLILILVAATWIRSRLLDIMPYGIECDEAGGGYEAVDIWKNQFQSITVHPCGRPLFMLLSKVVAFQFLGYENLGMRFMAMVWGVAGVLAVYLMSRLFYGPRIALGVAALLALSRWHIHFSRFGWSNTLMVLLLTIGFYFLIKGLVVRKKWHFVLAGASLSLSIQTETAARIIPIICAGLLAYFILSQKRFLQRNWKPLVALMLGVWLTGANLYLYWINKPHLLLRRVYEVSMFSEDANAPSNLWSGLVYSTKHSLTQLNWHGDYRTRHNGGLSGEPVLDFLTAILFALGFGMAIYYWRRLRYGLPIMLFFGFMFASIFSLEAPQSHRAFGVISAVFLMIGAFLDRTRRLLRESLGRLGVWAGALAFCILLVPIAR